MLSQGGDMDQGEETPEKFPADHAWPSTVCQKSTAQ